jgi:hypothetical protein
LVILFLLLFSNFIGDNFFRCGDFFFVSGEFSN